MPTLRPRFQVTETPAVARALRAAETAWPEVSRSERVLRLLQAGAESLEAVQFDQRAHRLAAVDFSAGSLDAAYEHGYLERLREDWPE